MQRWPPLATNGPPTAWRGYWWVALWSVPIVAVPVADWFLPPDIHLAYLLVVPLALSTAFADTRRTAVLAALAVAALIAAGAERHALTTENVLVQLLSLVLFSLLLLLVTRLREQQQRQLAGVRRVSEATQAVLMRPLPRRAGPVSLASAYVAAEAEARIGGDLYALVRTAGATRLIIGDARGKGLDAIGDIQAVLGAFRFGANQYSTLSDLATALDHSVRWDLAQTPGSDVAEWPGERFVTAAVLEIPDCAPHARLISFGHVPPLLLHNGTVKPIEVRDPAPPLGLGALAESSHTPMTFRFTQGDRLLLYTDGVSETRDGQGAFYPLEERLAAWAHHRPDTFVRTIRDDLQEFSGGCHADDMALIVLEREESPVRPHIHPNPRHL
ncbi:PP2C family protein-serine/threonine phosphatase [Streptomyces chiangmaiensis]|uniref:PP2C family protein-serine/threonine phosphatase n=1 Tax=Streptomyces chiangmaiensis TaxID=766497 RepID=UPI002E356B90|nr:PP2C family protein-serine/threonine phosphatase [Streptomyces chiangmaiensis]